MKNKWIIIFFALFSSLFLYSVSSIILPFIISFFGAYALSGITKKLVKKGISRQAASTIVITIFIVIIGLIATIAMPFIQKQLLLLIKKAPEVSKMLKNTFFPFVDYISKDLGIDGSQEFKDQFSNHVGDVVSITASIMRNIISSGMALANLISIIFLTPIIVFYLLNDWNKLIKYTESLIPNPYKVKFNLLISDIHNTLSKYIKSQAKVCGLLMIMYGFSLWAVGLKQGLFIGIVTGALSFIPYVGASIGFLASMALAFSQNNGPIFMALVAFVFLSIAFIEGHFIVPRVVGKHVGLHPVWMIFILFAGGSWFGFIGVLLAIPVGSIIGVIVRRIYNFYIGSSWYKTPNNSF